MSATKKYTDLYKQGKIEDTTLIKMAAFKEELNGLWKEANIGKTVGALALAAPIFGLSSYGLGKGLDYLEDKQLESEKEPAFQAMVGLHPDLLDEDQILVRKYWDSLWHFSPHIAKEPLAAGAYIKQAMEYEQTGGPTYNMVKDLIHAQDKASTPTTGLRDSVLNPMDAVFSTSMGDSGLGI